VSGSAASVVGLSIIVALSTMPRFAWRSKIPKNPSVH